MGAKREDSDEVPPMPLAMALVGQPVTFVGLRPAGRGLQHRLAEMGLAAGERMEILNRGPGPFIVRVKGSRLVLGRGIVQRILVRPG